MLTEIQEIALLKHATFFILIFSPNIVGVFSSSVCMMKQANKVFGQLLDAVRWKLWMNEAKEGVCVA